MDVIRCQVEIDARTMGVLQSQLNTANAALAVAKSDLSQASENAAKTRAELEWWKAAAKPLFEPKP